MEGPNGPANNPPPEVLIKPGVRIAEHPGCENWSNHTVAGSARSVCDVKAKAEADYWEVLHSGDEAGLLCVSG